MIPQYQVNKTKQHTQLFGQFWFCVFWFVVFVSFKFLHFPVFENFSFWSFVANSSFSRISRAGCSCSLSCFQKKSQVWPHHAKTLHWGHTHTSDLPSLTLSPHASTPHLLTQPHPTYSSPRAVFAPSSTHYPPLEPCTRHSHSLHGIKATFVISSPQNIPLRVLRTPVRESAFSKCESPTLALYQ